MYGTACRLFLFKTKEGLRIREVYPGSRISDPTTKEEEKNWFSHLFCSHNFLNQKLTGTVHRLKLKLIEKEFQYHFLPKELFYISEIRVGDLGSGKNLSRIRGSKLPVLWIWICIHLALLDPNSIGNTDPDPGT
jgi:hypothetical protein